MLCFTSSANCRCRIEIKWYKIPGKSYEMEKPVFTCTRSIYDAHRHALVGPMGKWPWRRTSSAQEISNDLEWIRLMIDEFWNVGVIKAHGIMRATKHQQPPGGITPNQIHSNLSIQSGLSYYWNKTCINNTMSYSYCKLFVWFYFSKCTIFWWFLCLCFLRNQNRARA